MYRKRSFQVRSTVIDYAVNQTFYVINTTGIIIGGNGTGYTGPTGSTGVTGPTGPTGAFGGLVNSSIIPAT